MLASAGDHYLLDVRRTQTRSDRQGKEVNEFVRLGAQQVSADDTTGAFGRAAATGRRTRLGAANAAARHTGPFARSFRPHLLTFQ